MSHRGRVNRDLAVKEPRRNTKQTKGQHRDSGGQLGQVSLTTLVILGEDQRAPGIMEERCVSVSQRNGMAWLRAQRQPLTLHHSYEWSVFQCQDQSCCQVSSSFFFSTHDLETACNAVLFISSYFFFLVLEKVGKHRGEVATIPSRSEKEWKEERERQDNTSSLSHLSEPIAGAAGVLPLGIHCWSIYRHCVMIDSCFGACITLAF